MTNLRTEFITWYFNEFHKTGLYRSMVDVIENSPYHREANVGVHTDMVVAQYISNETNPTIAWSIQTLCGALAAAFHDAGKPDACEEKYKVERGYYKGFGGHELISARLWEDFAVRNWKRLQEFGLVPINIYHIGWMIEHHLPWGVKKPEKRRILSQTVYNTGLHNAFCGLLTADTWGRISDDSHEKKLKADAWLNNFHTIVYNSDRPSPRGAEQPIMFVPIGPSGAGKSTYRKKLINHINIVFDPLNDVEIFCLDDLRMEWYLTDEEKLGVQTNADAAVAYKYAFDRSCDDKQFKSRANARYMEMIKTGNNVYLDNTNTSAKRRRFYITEARRHGYYIQAMLFPISLQTVIDRQKSRVDKDVPEHAVRRQYMGLQLPSYGDFDAIIAVPSNL